MLCLAAIALDLVWGYCGILSLGHFAFFALGGYLIGMWLMYERTKEIIIQAFAEQLLPPTPSEIKEAIGIQIFGVVGGSEIPSIWIFADYLFIHLFLIIFMNIGIKVIEEDVIKVNSSIDSFKRLILFISMIL